MGKRQKESILGQGLGGILSGVMKVKICEVPGGPIRRRLMEAEACESCA